MDIFSLSTTAPHFLHPPASASSSSSTSTTSSISFSLKPPPPNPPDPPNSANPSHSLRRPKTLKSNPASSPTHTPAPSTPKIPKNPLKNIFSPSNTPSPPPKTVAASSASSLSAKLWLSSKLSPPPPPPTLAETRLTENNSREELNQDDNEKPNTEFRQEGKIFVGNLPNWIKKPEVTEFFRQFGPIKSVILIKSHNETERNAGFGFIIYDGPAADKSAMKAVEFDGVEFHGRVLTVKLDDGRRSKAKAEERKRWVEGEEGKEFSSKWHEDREGSRKAFRKVLETQPENWQGVVSAFERIKKV